MSSKIERTIERLETALMIRPDDRYQRVQLGRAYQQAKRFPDAEEAYQRVLRVEPNNAEALFSLGLLRAEQERAEEALELYRRALAADGEHLGARRLIAEHAVEIRDFQAAREHYEQLVRLQPKEVPALRAYAAVLVRLGAHGQAAELLERALTLEPSEMACVQALCSCWHELREWQRIASLAMPLLESTELPLAVIDQLGRATRELGSLGEAEQAFRARLAREATTEARCGLAWVNFQRGRYPDVLKELERAEPPNFEVWSLRGRANYQSKQWDLAADALQHAVALAPGDGTAHHWLGSALLELGKLDEAVTHLRHAVRYLPQSVDSWLALATALVKLEQLNAATEPMERAIALEPSQAVHHARLGQHHVRLGRLDLAQACYSKAVQLAPQNGEFWLGLGEARVGLEQYAMAESDLVRATQILPSNPVALAALGFARFRGNKANDAISPLEQAIHLNPADLTSRLMLARAFLELRRFAEALAVLEKTPAGQQSSADVDELTGQSLFELRRYEEASATLARRTLAPNAPANSWTCLGLSLEQLGKHREAEASLRRATELDGVSTAALAGLGRCYLQLGDAGRAIEPLDRLLRLVPKDLVGWRLLGQAHRATGALRQARDCLEKALALAANDASTLEQHGLVLAALGDQQGALEQLTKACQLEPRSVAAWRKIAEIQEERRQVGAAMDAWRKVIAITPQDRVALGRLAQLCFELDDYTECLTIWRRVLQDDPNDMDALTGAARALAALQRDPESVEILRQVLRLEPTRSEQALELGRALARLGQYDEAASWLMQANSARPTADGWQQIAECWERLERPSEEVDALESCLALAPERGQLWRRLGLLALQLGYRPRAVAALEKAVELGQVDSVVQSTLGETLRRVAGEHRKEGANVLAWDALQRAERFQSNDPTLFFEQSLVLEALDQPAEVIERARRATILAPDNADYLLRLGTLLLAQKDVQAAQATFQRVTELAPQLFEGWVGLGNTLSGVGKRRLAIDAYRRGLSLSNANPNQRLTLGVWLAEEGQPREAVVELQRVLEDEPLNAEAARWLGRCLVRLEQFEPSTRAWRVVLRSQASDVEALMALGEAMWVLGKPKEASFPLEQLAEQLESGELTTVPRNFHDIWGRVLFGLGEHKRAEEAMRKALVGGSGSEGASDLAVLRVRSLLQLGRFEEAQRESDNLLSASPGDAQLLELRAQALAGGGQTDAAAHALRRVLDSGSTDQRQLAAERLSALYREQLAAAFNESDAVRAQSVLSQLMGLAKEWGEIGFTRSEGASWHERAAQIYRDRGDRESALTIVGQGLVHYSEDGTLHQLSGELWFQAGALEQALREFERSLVLRSTLSAWRGQGRVLRQLGRWPEAQASFERALQQGVDSGETLVAMASVHEEMLEVAKSLAAADLIVKHSEALGRCRSLRADEWRSLGFGLLAIGRHADAVEAFEAVLDERPNDGDVLLAMARALHLGQRGRAAIVALQRLVKQEPNRGDAWLDLARRQVELEANQAASEAYERAASLLESNDELGREWVASSTAWGDVEARERALAYACRAATGGSELMARWAAVLAELGQSQRAMEVLNGLLQSGRADRALTNTVGLQLAALELAQGQLLVQRDPEQARWMFTRAGEHGLSDQSTVLAVAQELADLGASAAAIQLCDQGLAVNPTADDLATFLGGLATKRGEHERAADAFERVIPRRADQVHVLLAAGRARLAANQTELAERWLKRAAHLEPNNPEVATLLEKATSALGRTDDTLHAQEALLQVNPKDAALHERYIRLLAAQGFHDRVAAAVRRAEAQVGPVPALLVLGAAALRASGRYAEAVILAERALSVAPREPTALRERGASQIELGELERGVESLLQAQAAEPNMALGELLALGLVGRGRVRIGRAEFDGAASDFERALQEGAEPLAVLPSLVNAARRAKQLARALGAARELSSLQSNASNWCMVGELCLELGQFQEAVEAFQSSLASEVTGEGYLGLGTAYCRLGDPRAKSALQRAVELRPGPEGYELLALVGERAGEWSEVMNALDLLTKHRELSDGECQRLAMSSERAGELGAAVRAWSELAARRPNDDAPRWEVGRLEFARGNVEASAQALVQVVASNPHHPQANGLLGRALMRVGRPAEALAALERQVQRSPEPDLLKAIAELQRQMGQASGSIESLERVVQLEPTNADAWCELASLLIGAARHNDAVSAARRSVNLRNDEQTRSVLGDVLVRFAQQSESRGEASSCRSALTECIQLAGVAPATLGLALRVCLEAKESELAVRAANLLLQKEPSDPRLHQALSRAWQQQQDWAKAASAMEAAVNLTLRHEHRLGKALAAEWPLDGTPEMLIEWSRLLEQGQQLVSAAQTADRAVRLGSTNPLHRQHAADLLLRAAEDVLGQGFAERALPLLERAAELTSHPAQVAFLTALAHRLLGNIERAVASARTCLQSWPTHLGAFRLGKELLARANGQSSKRVIEWFGEHPQAIGQEPELGLEHARLLLGAGEHEPARRAVWPLVDHPDVGQAASLVLADSFRATQEWEMEVVALTTASKHGKLSIEHQRRLGQGFEKIGRVEEAAVAFDKVLREENVDVEELMKVAALQLDVRRYDEALGNLERVLKVQPQHLAALRMKSWILKVTERPEERIRVLELVTKLEPQARELEELADLLLGLRRHEEAEQALAQWAKSFPKDSRAHLRCGLVRAQWGDPKLAIESLELATQLDGSLDAAKERLGELYEQGIQRHLIGREYREALAQCERWVASSPKHPDALHKRAECLQALGRDLEAVAVLRTVLAEHPGHSSTARMYAAQLVGEGNFDRAEAVLAKAVGTNRESVELMTTLTQLYVTQRKFEQAEIVASRALKTAPNDPDVLVLLSQIAANTARPQDAEDHVRQALRSNPNHSEANYTLGKLYLALGRYDLAKSQLDKLVRINSPRAEKLASRLERIKP